MRRRSSGQRFSIHMQQEGSSHRIMLCTLRLQKKRRFRLARPESSTKGREERAVLCYDRQLLSVHAFYIRIP